MNQSTGNDCGNSVEPSDRASQLYRQIRSQKKLKASMGNGNADL